MELLLDYSEEIHSVLKTTLPYTWDFFRIHSSKNLNALLNTTSYFVVYSAFLYWFTVVIPLKLENSNGHAFRKEDKLLAACISFFSASQVLWPIFVILAFFFTCGFYPWACAIFVLLLYVFFFPSAFVFAAESHDGFFKRFRRWIRRTRRKDVLEAINGRFERARSNGENGFWQVCGNLAHSAGTYLSQAPVQRLDRNAGRGKHKFLERKRLSSSSLPVRKTEDHTGPIKQHIQKNTKGGDAHKLIRNVTRVKSAEEPSEVRLSNLDSTVRDQVPELDFVYRGHQKSSSTLGGLQASGISFNASDPQESTNRADELGKPSRFRKTEEMVIDRARNTEDSAESIQTENDKNTAATYLFKPELQKCIFRPELPKHVTKPDIEHGTNIKLETGPENFSTRFAPHINKDKDLASWILASFFKLTKAPRQNVETLAEAPSYSTEIVHEKDGVGRRKAEAKSTTVSPTKVRIRNKLNPKIVPPTIQDVSKPVSPSSFQRIGNTDYSRKLQTQPSSGPTTSPSGTITRVPQFGRRPTLLENSGGHMVHEKTSDSQPARPEEEIWRRVSVVKHSGPIAVPPGREDLYSPEQQKQEIRTIKGGRSTKVTVLKRRPSKSPTYERWHTSREIETETPEEAARGKDIDNSGGILKGFTRLTGIGSSETEKEIEDSRNRSHDDPETYVHEISGTEETSWGEEIDDRGGMMKRFIRLANIGNPKTEKEVENYRNESYDDPETPVLETPVKLGTSSSSEGTEADQDSVAGLGSRHIPPTKFIEERKPSLLQTIGSLFGLVSKTPPERSNRKYGEFIGNKTKADIPESSAKKGYCGRCWRVNNLPFKPNFTILRTPNMTRSDQPYGQPRYFLPIDKFIEEYGVPKNSRASR